MGVEHLTPIKSNVYMHTKQGSGLKLLKNYWCGCEEQKGSFYSASRKAHQFTQYAPYRSYVITTCSKDPGVGPIVIGPQISYCGASY